MSTRVARAIKLARRKLKLPYSPGPRVRAITSPAINEIPTLRIFVIKVVRNLTLMPG